MLNTSRNCHDGYPTSEIVRNGIRTSVCNKTSPAEILQIPLVGKSNMMVTRRRSGAVILTSSPCKQDLEISKLNRAPRTKIFRKSTKNSTVSLDDSSTSSDRDDRAYLYCTELYFESTEGWVAYGKCIQRVHTPCVGRRGTYKKCKILCIL